MKRMTKTQTKEIRALRRMKSAEIDLTIFHSRQIGTKRSSASSTANQKISDHWIDTDVLAWLKRQGKGYQTRINGLLRNAMHGARPRAPH